MTSFIYCDCRYHQHSSQSVPGQQYVNYQQQPNQIYAYGGQTNLNYTQPQQDASLPPPPSPASKQYTTAYTPTYPQPQLSIGQTAQGLSPRDFGSSQQGSQSPVQALPAFLTQLLNTGLISGEANAASRVATGNLSEPLSLSGNLKVSVSSGLNIIFILLCVVYILCLSLSAPQSPLSQLPES